MAKNVEHVSHIKSKLKTNGLPQLPSPDKLVDGEIAINYAEGVETISIKNESGSIVTFSSDNYYTEKKLGSGFTNNDATVTEAIDDLEYMVVNKEEAIAAALNDLNGRKLDASAYTPTDLSNYYTKSETSGKTELSTAFSNKADSSVLTTHTADTTIHITSAERTAWNAKADMSDIPSVNGYADSVQYNSATKKVEFYHGTTAGTKVFEYDASPFLIDGMVQNVEIKDVQSGDPAITVTCLVVSFNTDAGKQDINIPISQIFDANNYYTTAQTSGATELQTAFNGKTDTATTTALNNVVTTHTANTNIHLTTTEKGQLHTHTNKTYLDSITSNVGTMAYENASSYSSATQVNTALSNKVDKTEYAAFSAATNASIEDLSGQSETVAAALVDLNTTITAHTASTVHMNDTEKTNLDSLATNIETISGITSTDKLIHDTINRRTRTDFTSKGLEWFKNTLKSAIADKSLEKYGLKVGDYYTATHNGKTYNYVIAGLNTMRGTVTPYRLNYDHVGIIVDTNDVHAWNTSNSTSTSQNTHSTDGTWTSGTAAAGYASCDLQYYLETTVLPNVEGDLGSSNIKSHYKLYSNAVNTSGYNRFGSAGGCSSSWAWYADQKICALSEVQVYGSIVWSSSGYDTGEACRQLDVFRVYNMNEIFEGRYPWLRDVASSSRACIVYDNRLASYNHAYSYYYVAALILFA